MRFFSILILAVAVLGISGCRTPRRTVQRPVIDTLFVQPAQKIRSLVTGKPHVPANIQNAGSCGACGSCNSCNTIGVEQFQGQTHFESGGYAQLPVINDCGCLPSQVVEFNQSQPVVEMSQPVVEIPQAENQLDTSPRAIIDLEPQNNSNTLTPSLDQAPSLEGKAVPQAVPQTPIIDNSPSDLLAPPTLDKNDSSQFVPQVPAIDEPIANELPVKTQIKAIPASSKGNTIFESKPKPFGEMSEEEAKSEATSELPASIQADEASKPIILRAVTSQWYKDKKVAEQKLAEQVRVNQENLLRQQQARITTEHFDLPQDVIPFSNLPPMYPASNPEIQFKDLPNTQNGSSQSDRPVDKTTQVNPGSQYYPSVNHSDQSANAKSIDSKSIDSQNLTVVESTATYQPQRTETHHAPTQILRLTAVTGSGTARVDSRANVASFKMEAPVIIQGGSATAQSGVVKAGASRVAEDNKNSKARFLDR